MSFGFDLSFSIAVGIFCMAEDSEQMFSLDGCQSALLAQVLLLTVLTILPDLSITATDSRGLAMMPRHEPVLVLDLSDIQVTKVVTR